MHSLNLVKGFVLFFTLVFAAAGILVAKVLGTDFASTRNIGNGFASGVLLAAALVHMLPESEEDLTGATGFPAAHTIAGLAFLLLMFIDQAAKKVAGSFCADCTTFCADCDTCTVPRAEADGECDSCCSTSISAPKPAASAPGQAQPACLAVDGNMAPGSETPALGAPLLGFGSGQHRGKTYDNQPPGLLVRTLCCVRRLQADLDSRSSPEKSDASSYVAPASAPSPPAAARPRPPVPASPFSEAEKAELGGCDRGAHDAACRGAGPGYDAHGSAEVGHDHSSLGRDACLIAARDGTAVSAAKAICLVVALSFHSVMEGLGLGSSKEANTLLSISLAILCHKGFAAFALGSTLRDSKDLSPCTVAGMALAFVLGTPIGGLIGWFAASSTSDSAVGLCTAAAAGTFLQVSTMELLPGALSSTGSSKFVVCLAVIVGYIAMSSLAIWC